MKDYNFFEVYDNKKSFSLNPGSPFFIGGIIILICLILSAGLIIRNRILMDSIDSSTTEWLSTKNSQDYILADQLQKSLDSMKDYEKGADSALEKFRLADIIDTKLIGDLFEGLPSTDVVTYFNLEGLNLSMTCDVPRREAAAELLLGLKETGLLETVKLDSVDTNQDDLTSIVRIIGILMAGEEE